MDNDYNKDPNMIPAPAPQQPSQPPAMPAAMPEAPPLMPERTAKKRRRTRPIEVVMVAMVLVMLVFLGILAFSLQSLASGFTGLFTPEARNTNPPANTFSVITVIGTIQNAGGNSLGMNEPSYMHGSTLSYIKQLTADSGNKGILLYMNTGGGGIYESDEVYRALMTYREETGRPVWAYMATSCASGGYYICMAAERLIANYNTTTGSIGVYITLVDSSAMYEGMGVKTILIRSGDNKGIGVEGTVITTEQQAVYQSMVDESYERFVELVMDGRGMKEAKVRELADGRPYTAAQALENGLVDELGDWEGAVKAFEEHTGVGGFMPSFSQSTPIGNLLGGLEDALPKGDAEVLDDMVNSLPTGVPLAYAPGLGW